MPAFEAGIVVSGLLNGILRTVVLSILRQATTPFRSEFITVRGLRTHVRHWDQAIDPAKTRQRRFYQTRALHVRRDVSGHRGHCGARGRALSGDRV